MSEQKKDPTQENVSIELDLSDMDLSTMDSLEGTALGSIVRELNEEKSEKSHARHSSHSSHTAHGTVAW